MKRLFLIVLSVIGTATLRSQDVIESKEYTEVEEGVSSTIGADLVNQYIWRGQELGNVSFQPTLGVGYKGFSLSAWGSVGISNWADTKELDFTLDYSYKGLNIGITDYWFSKGSNSSIRMVKPLIYGRGLSAMISRSFLPNGIQILGVMTVLILMGSVPIPVTLIFQFPSSLLQ